MSPSTEFLAPRRVRLAGAVMLLVLQGGALGAVLWATRDGGAQPAPAVFGHGRSPDQVVILEYFADDTLIVTGARGLQAVRLDSRTTVETIAGPGRSSWLLPGRPLLLREADDGRPVLRHFREIG